MQVDLARVDDAALALLALFSFDAGSSWQGYDFEAMGRLHDAGLIENPVNKNKSVVLTAAGLERGHDLAQRLFSK